MTPPASTSPLPTNRALLAIMGGGNMARAIILGALDAKLLAPGEIVVCEPDASKRASMKGWGVHVTDSHADALAMLLPVPGNLEDLRDSHALAACGGQVLLAVKPQSLPELARQIAPLLAERPRVIISILAGTSTQRIAEFLSPPETRDPNPETRPPLPIIRVMPNTPARLRKSMTAIALGEHVNPTHAALTHDLFASIGEVVKIKEDLMDAYTALVGSGPAYVFYLAEAMMAAAQEVGFDRITADRIVRQTIAGSASLLVDSSEPPSVLRSAVTSKGGTTEAACNVLDEREVMDAVVAAVVAGRDRGREMAK